VDTAAKALGYAVAKAPSFQERRRLSLGLHGLVTDQEQFFIEAFDRMGPRGTERTPCRRRRFRCLRSSLRWPRRKATRRSWPVFSRQSGCI
jgi:hypothetical protein